MNNKQIISDSNNQYLNSDISEGTTTSTTSTNCSCEDCYKSPSKLNDEKCDHNFEFGILKPRPYYGGSTNLQAEDVIVICSFCGECRLKEIIL